MHNTDFTISTFVASDGYPMVVTRWPAAGGASRGRVVVLHGVQSHGGWYHGLGQTLSEQGHDVTFPDRRGSGSNTRDRGHAPSARRLINDIVELLATTRNESPHQPTTLVGISWGGKLATVAAARRPDLVDGLALICPGLHPRVGVSRRDRLRIFLAFLLNRRKMFPIPLADPALFTDNPDRQAYIAADPLSLHEATASLLAASVIIDRLVARARRRVRARTLLMLAGRDRIVDNARTLRYFERMTVPDRTLIEYPDGCHTREFDPDPTRYALDLAAWLGRA